MSTRELIENYTAYTDALEMSHSAAADSTARSTPFCITASIIATEIVSTVVVTTIMDRTFG